MEIFLLSQDKPGPAGVINITSLPETNQDHIVRSFGGFRLFLSGKSSSLPVNYYEKDGFFTGAVGTFSYGGCSYTDSLKKIHTEYLDGSFDHGRLIGHYYIFIWNGSLLTVLNDGSGILKAYHTTDNSYFSNSFTALAGLIKPRLTLNKDVLLENLLTGSITGNETVIDEIRQLSAATSVRTGNLHFVYPGPPEPRSFSGEASARRYQLELISNYFDMFRNMADEFGADIGLTGGLDSRLILGFTLEKFSKYQVHSHYRHSENIDRTIAGEITAMLGRDLVSPPVSRWGELGPGEKISQFEQSYIFSDGQIRRHNFWDEAYNTCSYIEAVQQHNMLNFSGIGGEQYRNGSGSQRVSVPLSKWIQDSYIRPYLGHGGTDSRTFSALTERMEHKINGLLNNGSPGRRLSTADIKRIENEVIIPSYRGIRSNSVNRIKFSLSPFADYRLSREAYSIIPYLGKSLNFEIGMLQELSPSLAKIRSAYGFPLNRKETFRSRVLRIGARTLIPAGMILLIKHRTWRFKSLLKKRAVPDPDLRIIMDTFNSLELPADTATLLHNPQIERNIYALGFMVAKLQDRI